MLFINIQKRLFFSVCGDDEQNIHSNSNYNYFPLTISEKHSTKIATTSIYIIHNLLKVWKKHCNLRRVR